MSQRKATYTCQSSGRGRGCSTATPSLGPALWCSPVCPSVQMGQRAEQSPHYLIGKKMPFSLSSTFAQSLSSFVRAVLPHTLCPACTRTHTHTHNCFGHRNIHLSPLLWKVKEKASALNFRWISCTHTPVILVVGSYTIWETPGCMGVQEASDGSLWVSDPVRLLPNKI